MTRTTVALDIGATKTLIGFVRRERVVAMKRYETAALLRPGGDISALVERIRGVWKPTVGQVGVGFAGPVHDGVVEVDVNFPPGLVPKAFSLEALLGRALKVPVTVMNDAQCFALGEATYGAGRRYRRVVGVTLGTGVGGGVVIDGELYRGEHQVADEFGHVPFPLLNLRCGCGQVGHLETVLSGPGLMRLYASATRQAERSEAIIRAARRGDAAAKTSLQAIEEALVHLLLTIIVTWDPSIVVVGGGFAEVPHLIVRARGRVRERVPYPSMRNIPIVPSLLHEQAILLGAAHAAQSREAYRQRVSQRRLQRRANIRVRLKKLTGRLAKR